MYECTVFENHRKRSHILLRAKRATFKFLSGQKLVKNLNWRTNSVTRQVNLDRTKINGNTKNSKIQMRDFELFPNNVTMLENCQKGFIWI